MKSYNKSAMGIDFRVEEQEAGRVYIDVQTGVVVFNPARETIESLKAVLFLEGVARQEEIV